MFGVILGNIGRNAFIPGSSDQRVGLTRRTANQNGVASKSLPQAVDLREEKNLSLWKAKLK